MTGTTARPVPVLDARGSDFPAALACRELPAETRDLIQAALKRYTPLGVRLGDAVSRRWLARNPTPYGREVEAVAAAVARPGAHLLNTSFEWGCTTAALPSRSGGMALLRVLDWDLDGLGRNLAVIRQEGAAGEWLNIGWPGFVGCITGLAPGRFAAAINQPPLPETRVAAVARRSGLPLPAAVADWAAQRPATWRGAALPPAHLLRLAMETARDFAAAVEMLAETPVAAPVLFAVAGARRGEGAVIERDRHAFRLRRAEPAVAAANHWDAMPIHGQPRWRDSHARQALLLRAALPGTPGEMPELGPPILGERTRLVALLDAGAGAATLAGYERHGRATLPLHLEAAFLA